MYNNDVEWNDLTSTPPENMIAEVRDIEGNIGHAEPTYFPFDIIKKPGDENKPWGWRGTPVFHEDGKARWDGGWLLYASDLSRGDMGVITHWRESLIKFNQDEK
jgi:hypothetical protein